MTLLTPLGLLGLISILILILIYIIKPNFQQKRISSTFVWKLSLQIKKKRMPFSKLRNILIIICQVLALTTAAIILTQPNKIIKVDLKQLETIVIIDSSASMRTEYDTVTRYERAVEKAREKAESTFEEGGLVSVIVANEAPYFLEERVSSDNSAELYAALDEINDIDACSYASADIDAALSMCEPLLENNSSAQIVVVTDKSYYSNPPEGVTVEDVKNSNEFNVGILDAKGEWDNEKMCYTFTVKVGFYGAGTSTVILNLNIQGANAESSEDTGVEIDLYTEVDFSASMEKTVIFEYYESENNIPDDTEDTVYCREYTSQKALSYQNAVITVVDTDRKSSIEDNFTVDDTFQLYGGQKRVIKIQYASALPNRFTSGVFAAIKEEYSSNWDIQITETKQGESGASEGFDLYIYEDAWDDDENYPSVVPDKLPTDGAILLINPFNTKGVDFNYVSTTNYMENGNNKLRDVVQESDSELLDNVFISHCSVSRYNKISGFNDYEVLISSSDKDPIYMVKNKGAEKIAVLNFSVHYSGIVLTTSWANLMDNLFNDFFPMTIEENAYEVNEEISLNCMGETLIVSGTNMSEGNVSFDSFPATLKVTAPGTYTFTQTTWFGENVEEDVFVHIPEAESNIFATDDSLTDPRRTKNLKDYYDDLLLYFAIALVSLLFIEWFLHTREEA